VKLAPLRPPSARNFKRLQGLVFPIFPRAKGRSMTWSTPVLIEICIGLEINRDLPAEL